MGLGGEFSVISRVQEQAFSFWPVSTTKLNTRSSVPAGAPGKGAEGTDVWGLSPKAPKGQLGHDIEYY